MKRLKIILALAICSLTINIYGANRYWIAASTANWNTSANWSTTSGGAGGASVPGSSDIAIFNGSGTGNCTVDATINVAGIDLQTGYTGTLAQGAYSITVGTSNAIFTAGTFTGGSLAITVNGTFTLAGTAFTSTSNTMTLNSSVTNSSGSFTHNNGTVSFSGTGAQTIPAWNFYDLSITGSRNVNSITLVNGGTIGVSNTFTSSATFTFGAYINTNNTIEYKGTGAQTITAFNYYNLTSSSTGSRTLASSGTICVANNFTKGTNSYTITGSTINYNGTGAQTITAFNYNNLIFSGSHAGSITLASSGTIGIAGTLTNSASFSSGGFVITTSTVSYNGTGTQTVLAFDYHHLTITGSRTSNNVTLANSGTIKIAGTFTNSATFTTGGFVNTSSTIEYNGTGAQTIGAFNYNNLTVSGSHAGSITLASTGIIGIAGTFINTATFSSGAYVNTSSTINYNGTGAQTIIPFDYYNLYISGARGSNNITLSSAGTIKVAKIFNNFATFTSGSYVNTSSTFEYNGSLLQVIQALPYNNLTSSSSGSRSLGSVGTIGISGTLTKGSNTYISVGLSGEGYQPQYSGISASLLGSAVISSSVSFISGGGGTIVKTTDGGATWTSQTSNTSNDLYSIAFIDANTGIAAGNSGTIIRTTNGGTTWAAVTSGTAQHLRSATFISSTVGFVTGANGVILKTTDAGATWSATTSGTSQTIYSVSFTTSSIGYASGGTGTILKTTNSGSTWSALSSGTTELLGSIQFVNTAIGVAAGANGKIVRTTDAGATWTTISSGTSDNFSNLAFIDINNGFIAGGNVTNNTGTLMQTTNGGLSWTLINPGTSRLYGIDVLDATTAFITGLDGNILKYSCCSNGSTVDFNGTGAQTIPRMSFNNLIISGARTSNSVTLTNSGNIEIAGNFTKSATFTSGGFVTTGNTVDLNGNKAQSIPAFSFNNLTTSGTGTKTLSGNVTVGSTLNLSSAELALGANSLTMSSSTYSVVTQTSGYISSTGAGKFTRPTNSTNAYLFPIGYKTTNDSADYFVLTLNPGKSAAQQFDAALHSESTGIVITHDKTLHGSVASTVDLSIATRSYNALQIEYDINTSADISAIRIMDLNDNTLKTLPSGYYTVTGGNTLFIPNIYQLCLIYSKASMNTDMNWTYEINYDGNGLPLTEKVKYSDLLGRTTQQLSRNVATNQVLAAQTIYDSYGRAALQTLPAPVGSVMTYQASFINNNSGTAYAYTDFDKTVTSSNLPGEINNPIAVQNSIAGTLGYYYSDNNSLEPYQATTSYPYMRKEMTAGQRSALAGDEYRMGSGHETKGYEMVAGDELKFIFGTNKSYKSSIDSTDKLVNSALTITGGIVANKTITVDADGKETVSYVVNEIPIASCFSGLTGACTMTTVTNVMKYAGTSSVDIHLPAANNSSLKLFLPEYEDGGTQTVAAGDVTFKITDLSTNTVLVNGTDYSVNSGTRAVSFVGSYTTGSKAFRISFSMSQSKIDYFIANAITEVDAEVTYSLDYSRWSVNYYDLAERLRKSVSPKGINCSSAGTITMSTTYDYNSMGQLVASNSPDEGKKEMTYDSEGKPRFSQSSVQHTANKFSYINYDIHGRVTESGEYSSSNNGSSSVFFQNYYAAYSAPYSSNTASSSIINNIGNIGMRAGDCGDKNNIYYYPMDAGEDISSSYSYKSSYSAKYLMGHICKTKNAQSATWYSYDQAGHTIFTVQQVLDAQYATYNTTVNKQIKTVDYTYNTANGTLTSQVYQNNETAEKLSHNFYYDASLRLTRVDVEIGAGGAATQAKYYYSQIGVLERKEIGDKLQGVDYIYTVNGQLKSINHPACDETKDPGLDGNALSPNAAFGKDVFGLAIDYHTNDYIRTGSYVLSAQPAELEFYTGLISSTRNRTRATTNSVNNGADYIDYLGTNSQQILSSSAEELMTQYTYDEENRLSTAVWGKFNNGTQTFTANSNNCFKEYGASGDGGINYDANGNITSLKRNAYNGTLGLTMDDFTYTYTSNTNKLASIVDAATSTYTNDFDAATSKTFTYNTDGQMTADAAESISTVEYYNTGLTKLVNFNNHNSAEYFYDDRGQKIKTVYYIDASSKYKYTWYISDAGGNPLAVYEYDEAAGSPAFTLVDQPIYGNERLGVIDRVNSNTIEYEMTDHLGNVRATIKGISTGVYELTSRTDYYAFGGAMPGRTYNLNTYRYNYQGQENAVSSNWQQFDLRMHNSDLGRWMSPDPMGQFYSPYISMGNNPVSGTDPDGGYALLNGMGIVGDPNGPAADAYWEHRRSFESYESFFYKLTELKKKYGLIAKDFDHISYDLAPELLFMSGDAGQEYIELLFEYGRYNNDAGRHGGTGFRADNSMASFAHGGFISALEMNGQNTGFSYEAQESDRIKTLASLGGYEDKKGNLLTYNDKGQLGVWQNSGKSESSNAKPPGKSGFFKRFWNNIKNGMASFSLRNIGLTFSKRRYSHITKNSKLDLEIDRSNGTNDNTNNGISWGFRIGNMVIIDFNSGTPARNTWDVNFPGRDQDRDHSNDRTVQFFYRVTPFTVPWYNRSQGVEPHFIFGGYNWFHECRDITTHFGL